MVDLNGRLRPVLADPFGDEPGGADGRAFALDEGDDLVLFVRQLVDQPAARLVKRLRDHDDAVAGDPEVVARGDRARVGFAVAHGARDLARHDAVGARAHIRRVLFTTRLWVVLHERR